MFAFLMTFGNNKPRISERITQMPKEKKSTAYTQWTFESLSNSNNLTVKLPKLLGYIYKSLKIAK